MVQNTELELRAYSDIRRNRVQVPTVPADCATNRGFVLHREESKAYNLLHASRFQQRSLHPRLARGTPSPSYMHNHNFCRCGAIQSSPGLSVFSLLSYCISRRHIFLRIKGCPPVIMAPVAPLTKLVLHHLRTE